jgi:hypothetical protein
VIEEKVSEFGEIALGVYKTSTKHKNDKQLNLNPQKNTNIEISSGTRLVVLTTVY